jgi:ABC transporter with metal-binding/Fe-S-binding domain ATP-binding protein
LAAEKEEVACLITLVSKNPESYMFHTPNIKITALQAEALGLPLVSVETEGKKEEELEDLKSSIVDAKSEFGLDGIVTGAVESVYQASRVQRICSNLNLWSFNPLWKCDQRVLLQTIIEKKFVVIISGVFAYPLDEKWLGKKIDSQIIEQLIHLQRQYSISPTGEGGEIETTVLDAPLFKQRLEITQSVTDWRGNCGLFKIKQVRLVPK